MGEPGSGQTNYRKYKGWGICPNCDQTVNVTSTGKIKSHYLPFNGRYCPICPSSSEIFRGVLSKQKKHEVQTSDPEEIMP